MPHISISKPAGALILIALIGCNDFINNAESESQELFCSMNEPFVAITFNAGRDGSGAFPVGSGTHQISMPNDNPPPYILNSNVTREFSGSLATGNTPFLLSNGIEGEIEETPGGACVDDMAGSKHDYKITITNWGTSGVSQTPHWGCCTRR